MVTISYCSPDFRGTGRCESYRLLSDVNISVGNYKTCDILKCVTCPDYLAFSHVVLNDHVNECDDVITPPLRIHTHNPLRQLGISLRARLHCRWLHGRVLVHGTETVVVLSVCLCCFFLTHFVVVHVFHFRLLLLLFSHFFITTTTTSSPLFPSHPPVHHVSCLQCAHRLVWAKAFQFLDL